MRWPELAGRPFSLTTDRFFNLRQNVLYAAWTTDLDHWFAAPGTLIMKAEINSVFFFETQHRLRGDRCVSRQPHYGRFLKLVPYELIVMTWLTGEEGTGGAETILSIELIPQGDGTVLRLTHEGFRDEDTRDEHGEAWPYVLSHLERSYSSR